MRLRSLFNILIGHSPLKDMSRSVKRGSGDPVNARDSPRGSRSKDLNGVPHNPNGIDNAADEHAVSSRSSLATTNP